MDHADHHSLGRSKSDVSTEAADQDHSHDPDQALNFDSSNHSVHSMEGTGDAFLTGSMQETPSSEPNTPNSVGGSTTFNPFHPASHHLHNRPGSSDSSWHTPTASVDGSIDSKHAKHCGSHSGSRRKSKHSRKAAKKAAPAKRRFIPGLDSEFDPAIHELPTPPQDPFTDPPRQKGAVESVGSSVPSPSSPLPAVQCRRELSVDAQVFVPTGYAQSANFGTNSVQYPSQRPVHWYPQAGASHSIGHAHPTAPYQYPQTLANSGPMCTESTLSPRPSHASTSSSSSFGSYLNRTSPIGRPLYHDAGPNYSHTPPPGVSKSSPRYSPTSVLPSRFSPAEFSQPSFSTATAQDRPPQLGFVHSPRGWRLPPLLEEVVGSPFPGMTGLTESFPCSV